MMANLLQDSMISMLRANLGQDPKDGWHCIICMDYEAITLDGNTVTCRGCNTARTLCDG